METIEAVTPTRACPFCATSISVNAVVCPHCRSDLRAGVNTSPGVNGFAIASMVLGILWLYWVGSILALVFGYIARKQIRESIPSQTGGGMAVAGIVLGWIGVGVLAFVLVIGWASFAGMAAG